MNLINFSHIVIKKKIKEKDNIELDLTPHPCMSVWKCMLIYAFKKINFFLN